MVDWDLPEHSYKAFILDINARYIVPGISTSWKVEYRLQFKRSDDGRVILTGKRIWYDESRIKEYSLQEERDNKIDQLLNE